MENVHEESQKGGVNQMKNIFALHKSKSEAQATAEIYAALKTKNLNRIAKVVTKWRHLGAEDTASREAIVTQFAKMGEILRNFGRSCKNERRAK